MSITTIPQQPEVNPAPVEPPSADLDRSLIHGVAWTGGVKWASQGLSWVATILVARMLTPEDYGLVGMATVFFGLVTVLTEFGIGTAIVAIRQLTTEQLKQLNGLALLFGVGGYAAALMAAVPLARFFDAPELVGIVCVLGSTFVITSLRSVPAAVLQRNLRFRLLAILDGAHAVIMSVTWVVLAFLGLRYWTLVIGAIAGSTVLAGLTLAYCRVGFAFPRRRTIDAAVTFSRDVVVARFCWYAQSNADFVVAGRMLGEAALGGYGFAWTMASMPVEKITALIGSVAPAVFSAVQENRPELRRYLLTLTEGLAVLTFPAAVGLAVVADTFVLAVLGDHWVEAIVPLRLLAVYAVIRSISPLLSHALAMIHETRFLMKNSILMAAVLPLAFVVGARWGVVGIAAAWLIVHPLLLLPVFLKAFRCLELRVADYLRVLWPSAFSAAVMAAGVWGLKTLWPEPPSIGYLVIEVGTGAILYLASMRLVHPEGISRLRRVVATARG